MKCILDRESALINHVWKECLKKESGKALFLGDALALKFLGGKKTWADAYIVLDSLPEIKVHLFEVDGLTGQLFGASINSVYCSPEFKKLSAQLHKANGEFIFLKKKFLKREG
jgi:hypothetical protein